MLVTHPEINVALMLAVAYLLGSVPFGYILVRMFRHEDIRKTGSGNIGATNVARSGAKGLGIATLLLDTLKGAVAVLVARHFFPADMTVAATAGLASILGHVFPVWLGFRGGKGVASALGVFLALCWPAALSALAVFLLLVAITRYVSLASVLAAITLPFFFLYFMHDHRPIVVVSVSLISLIVIVKHHANIGRLLSGTESRFGSTTKA
jgi:glycerol-3-phosphate acyltransferase PlsY